MDYQKKQLEVNLHCWFLLSVWNGEVISLIKRKTTVFTRKMNNLNCQSTHYEFTPCHAELQSALSLQHLEKPGDAKDPTGCLKS